MDVYNDYYNPGSYDERLLADKLGFSKKPFNLNEKLRNDELEEKLRQSKEELQRARRELETQAKQPRREHFTVGGCGCGCDNMRSSATNAPEVSSVAQTGVSSAVPNPIPAQDTMFGMPMKNFLILVVAVFMAVLMFQHNQLSYEIRELKNILKPQSQPQQSQQPPPATV
jgi:hypothetical protein